jgi:hypothetical protein
MNDVTIGRRAFGGYYKPKDRPVDDELSKSVSTPCGEYLRRFWHPITMSARLAVRPRSVRPG